MYSDQEIRQIWRDQWLSSIQEFADIETQNRMWLDRSNTNPHWSFTELMCCYFDDLRLTDYSAALSEGMVTHKEVAAVANFHQMAINYQSPTNEYDFDRILADPKWLDVIAAALAA
ncbi:MAG: hypothetical protein ACJAXK_000453 [Yoonia sp.]|jgi:hypothetical protein